MRLSLLTVCALLVLAAPAAAQVQFGAQLNFADDFDFGVGARALFDTGEIVESTRVAASFDFYFPDDGSGQVDTSFWEINANAHYFFPIENSPVNVYAGAGLHFYKFSADIDDVVVPGFGTISGGSADDDGAGLNILGGVEFPLEGASVTPFAELKFEISGAEQFVLTGGVTF